MTPIITFNRGKVNPFLPSEQVKNILKEKGFSKVFNYNDYNYYKDALKGSFNLVQAIANKFIEDNLNATNSDLADYIF